MHRWMTLVFATLTLLCHACCSGAAEPPPPIAPPPEQEGASGGEAQSSPPPPSGVDEAQAVNIAMQLAEQQGYDLALYEDITVHQGQDNRWLVQLRRPMATRFLEVTVDKQSGAAELVQRATNY